MTDAMIVASLLERGMTAVLGDPDDPAALRNWVTCPSCTLLTPAAELEPCPFGTPTYIERGGVCVGDWETCMAAWMVRNPPHSTFIRLRAEAGR